eukprot:scaffold21101_cov56-Attheya_sp.AAC.4
MMRRGVNERTGASLALTSDITTHSSCTTDRLNSPLAQSRVPLCLFPTGAIKHGSLEGGPQFIKLLHCT